MTADQTPQTPGSTPSDDSSTIAATVLTAVERQLTRYFAAITKKVDDSLVAAEQLRADVREGLARQTSRLDLAVDSQRAATEAYQQALERALDERLAELAAHSTSRLNDFDRRLAVVAAQPVGVSPEELLQIRQGMREDIWKSIGPVTERLDVLSDNLRKTDDHASSLVTHVNTTTAHIVSRIDDSDQRARQQFEERAAAVAAELQQLSHASEARAAELAEGISALDERATASVAAVEGRLGDSITALTQRLADVEHRTQGMQLDLAHALQRLEGIDEEAIEVLKAQMSSAVGEAMLVRIELDRVVATLEERFDRQAVRLGEIEGLLSDTMDVSAAVQLERLDELERAVAVLDPAQFVRKDEILTTSPDSGFNPYASGADTTMHERVLGGETGLDSGQELGGSSDHDGHSVAASASEYWS